MTTWAQFRTDLMTAVKTVVPNDQVVWRDAPRPFKKPNAALVILHISKFDFGLFEEKRSEDVDPDTLNTRYVGRRSCTVSFRIEKHQHNDAAEAINTADTIASQLVSFNDQSSLNGVRNFIDLEYFEDDRAVSVVLFDMVWNVTIDRLKTAVDFFDSIELSSDLQNVDGVEFPIPPNFENELISAPSQATTLGVGSDTLVNGPDVLLNA